jgi:glycosyltransferase involved in cell wall biosynthesis
VLLVSHHTKEASGGASIADLALARELGSQGWQVETLFFEDVLPVWMKATWRQLAFPWFVAPVVARRHLREPYDVIESTAGDLGPTRMLLAAAGSRPQYSVHTHGLEHLRAEWDLSRAHREGTDPSVLSSFYHYSYRLGEVARDLRAADAAFFVNSEDARYAVQYLGVSPRRAHVSPNGVPAHLLAGSAPLSHQRLFQLLFIGAWSPMKGADLVPAIFTALHGRESRFRLTCAGTQASAERVLSDFPPGDRESVEVIPRYTADQLGAILDRHGVLLGVSPAEGCSLALLEAMASGLVAVSAPVGYARDVIRSSRNGILVSARDAGAFVDAIDHLARNPDRALSQARLARRHLRTHSWPRLVAQRTSIWNHEAAVPLRRPAS